MARSGLLCQLSVESNVSGPRRPSRRWPADCGNPAPRSCEIFAGRKSMTRRPTSRSNERETFLKKLRRYPVDRALSRVGEGRRARDFWDLVQMVLARR